MSLHKCRHCGEDIRSVRLWLPRPPDWPGGILTPPPWDTAYEALEDGDRFCRLTEDPAFLVRVADLFDLGDGTVAEQAQLAHQPMPRIRT